MSNEHGVDQFSSSTNSSSMSSRKNVSNKTMLQDYRRGNEPRKFQPPDTHHQCLSMQDVFIRP